MCVAYGWRPWDLRRWSLITQLYQPCVSGDNIFAIETDWYRSNPLILHVQGPGAKRGCRSTGRIDYLRGDLATLHGMWPVPCQLASHSVQQQRHLRVPLLLFADRGDGGVQ